MFDNVLIIIISIIIISIIINTLFEIGKKLHSSVKQFTVYFIPIKQGNKRL